MAFEHRPFRSATLKTPVEPALDSTQGHPHVVRRWSPLAGCDGGAPDAQSSLPPQRAARRSVAIRDLDMPPRMGEAAVSEVPRCEGLGTAGWGKLGGPNFAHLRARILLTFAPEATSPP